MLFCTTLKRKSEVGAIFQIFHKMIKTQFNTIIQVLRSDNACEYFTSTLNSRTIENDIIHQSSASIPFRRMVLLREKIDTFIMFAMNVPKQFWGEAILTTTYLINRMSSRALKYQTPFNLLSESFPHSCILYSLPLKVFGCSSYVHIHSHLWGKLDPKAL